MLVHACLRGLLQAFALVVLRFRGRGAAEAERAVSTAASASSRAKSNSQKLSLLFPLFSCASSAGPEACRQISRQKDRKYRLSGLPGASSHFGRQSPPWLGRAAPPLKHAGAQAPLQKPLPLQLQLSWLLFATLATAPGVSAAPEKVGYDDKALYINAGFQQSRQVR